MPKCTINGQEVEVKDGATIIEAYKAMDEDICHYCWHPGLSIAGVCRLCMVDIEGNPRTQIACNTVVQEGMVITNQSEKIKETVKWGLDFHLINHPLDCPICDQAGECGLQDQYMKFGQYDPEMAENKVKKRKVVDLGPTVVLDSERCILCSRCVRFTDEVSKTNELGIFNRGDRSEIGTFKDKPLDNNYSLNTVDICPVGALTSKDFRFRQRVWYLKEHDTICNGCSTGCNVTAFYNEEGMHRVKPRHNEDVNGYWMCDKGRDFYKFVNRENRLTLALKGHGQEWQEKSVHEAAGEVAEHLAKRSADEVAVVVTGQYSNEEYEALFSYATGQLGTQQIYHWINNAESFEDFDGLLYRGDHNPNTKGLLAAFEKHDINASWADLKTKLESGKIKTLIVAAPENATVYPDLEEKFKWMGKTVENLVWLSPAALPNSQTVTAETWCLPIQSFVEKPGTYVNAQGTAQVVAAGPIFVANAVSLTSFVSYLRGEDSDHPQPTSDQHMKTNYYISSRDVL